MVRHKIEDETQAALGEHLPGGCEPLRTAEMCIDDVAAHAVGRADIVLPREKSGRARRKSSRSPSFRMEIAIPAGLRSQTPMNQTASKPWAAMASHSCSGTVARFTGLWYFRLRSPSQTQVLIS